MQPVSLMRLRCWVPEQFEIVQIWPGLTLGGLYLAQYNSGSTLIYQELIVVAGLVRYAGKIGFWISHIYVDNLASVAGGQEIWGLPKEMATFTGSATDQLSITAVQPNLQPGLQLCDIAAKTVPATLRLWFPVAAFGQQAGRTLWFTASARFQLQWASSVHIRVPSSSPFASLGLDSPWLVFRLKSLQLDVKAPQMLN
ncbi:MAG: acetoacetate decarboxylase family protein [Leptolyngbyaceae cyanobacterium RM2_2_21]|nr:acetoacetate decarboxylase family protein [Leptolyngbyaceae cyanobacterium RM2_2_21]